jgi:hypothetical protein
LITAKRFLLTLGCEARVTGRRGKPVADVYTSKTRQTGQLREGHVFEGDVTSGDVLNGCTRPYILLYIMHDNEA